MLSERYRPKTWAAFVGQPVIAEIQAACGDSWLFDGGGERWLFESDGIAGCGKTSAAYVAARALDCADYDILKLDSRSTTVAELRTRFSDAGRDEPEVAVLGALGQESEAADLERLAALEELGVSEFIQGARYEDLDGFSAALASLVERRDLYARTRHPASKA